MDVSTLLQVLGLRHRKSRLLACPFSGVDTALHRLALPCRRQEQPHNPLYTYTWIHFLAIRAGK